MAGFNDGTAIGTGAIKLGSATTTANYTNSATSATLVTSMSAAVTILAGGRGTLIALFCSNVTNDGGGGVATTETVTLWDGTVGSGTQLQAWVRTTIGGAYAMGCSMFAFVTPSAGAKTYNVGLHGSSGSQTNTFTASATAPATLIVLQI